MSPKTNNRGGGGVGQLEGGKNDTIFSSIILTRYVIKANVKRNEKKSCSRFFNEVRADLYAFSSWFRAAVN